MKITKKAMKIYIYNKVLNIHNKLMEEFTTLYNIT